MYVLISENLHFTYRKKVCDGNWKISPSSSLSLLNAGP
jgi:hypothetical protein